MGTIPLPNSLVANRFWDKVDILGSDECWEWLGAIDKSNEYGRVSDGEFVIYAHRLSWMLTHGDIPKFIDGRKTIIRHLCGNSSCVNPEHLAIGNGSDNNNDKFKAGKGGLKFTLDDIRTIKNLRLFNIPIANISEMFDVHPGTVRNVLKGKGIYSSYLETLNASRN